MLAKEYAGQFRQVAKQMVIMPWHAFTSKSTMNMETSALNNKKKQQTVVPLKTETQWASFVIWKNHFSHLHSFDF